MNTRNRVGGGGDNSRAGGTILRGVAEMENTSTKRSHGLVRRGGGVSLQESTPTSNREAVGPTTYIYVLPFPENISSKISGQTTTPLLKIPINRASFPLCRHVDKRRAVEDDTTRKS